MSEVKKVEVTDEPVVEGRNHIMLGHSDLTDFNQG